MKRILRITLLWCLLISFGHTSAQRQPDLSKTENLVTANRTASIVKGSQRGDVIHLDARDGAGVAWIKGTAFREGTIEFDVKGKNVVQESFVGIAFHGINDSTYEAVYFRPFNFQSDDAVMRSHAVQYISLPRYDWFHLRDTYPDKYEHSLLSSVMPDSWFHVRIEVSDKDIKAFVNSDKQPSLVVSPLTRNAATNLGFWVGNGSDGDFSNLIIKSR